MVYLYFLLSSQKYITNMELRIVELAHKRGLTMSDIAKMIGISRVNLSNSLNGNPTLSRLKEVANILHVEVAELFKTSTKESISGYVEYNGKIVKIESVSALRTIVAETDSNSNTLTLDNSTIDSLLKMKRAYEMVYNKEFTMDEFVIQMSASVEEGDVAVWEEYCKAQE